MNWLKTLMVGVLISICAICNSQIDNLTKEIEYWKGFLSWKGLDKIDSIEGIYLINEKVEDYGFQGQLYFLNEKKNFIHYVLILEREDKRSENKKCFYLLWYSENFGEFRPKRTNWIIEKTNGKYIYTKEIRDEYLDIDCNVFFNGNELSFKKESRLKDQGVFLSYFNSIEKIYPSSNIIKTGTGFFISKNGHAVTNYHVIEGSSNIYVTCHAKRMKAKLLYVDKLNDIALLKTDTILENMPLNLVSFEKEIGSNIFTLGYPLVQSMGKELKLTNGIINSKTGFEDDYRYYQISAEIQPGNSGGPLFDSDGNIIGIITSKHNLATNAGYALKSKYIIDFVKAYEPTILSKNINSINALSLSSKYKILKDYLILVEIE